MDDEAKTAIVDFIMQRDISDIDTALDDLGEKLIKIGRASCRERV